MKENIVLSICCLTFNHENYLEYCLKGFLFQETDFKFEIIIHDDASTDSTVNIIEKFRSENPNLIKVIYQKENQYSQGKPVLENLFEKAQGKYLAICEGDDYWSDKYKLQKQIDFLEKNKDYVATYHNVLVVDEMNNKRNLEQEEHPFYKNHDIEIKDIEENSLAGQTASIVCRNFWRDFTQKQKKVFISKKANGDTKLSSIFVFLGKVYYFSEIMSCYRKIYSGSSWSATNSKKNMSYFYFSSRLELKKMIFEIFQKEYNPNIHKFILSSLKIMLKNPNKNNIQIFFTILKETENKMTEIIKLVKSVFRLISVKMKICEKSYRWPLLEKKDISDEVLSGK